MIEPIKLKVPAEQKAEFVSQGNFEADLTKKTVETTSRTFADWLINEHGLTEIGAEKTEPASEAGQPLPVDFEAQYPADFPKREVFVALGMPFETARYLSREQLIAVNGIKDKTADKILAWQPAPVETTEETGNETNGGQE